MSGGEIYKDPDDEDRKDVMMCKSHLSLQFFFLFSLLHLSSLCFCSLDPTDRSYSHNSQSAHSTGVHPVTVSTVIQLSVKEKTPFFLLMCLLILP